MSSLSLSLSRLQAAAGVIVVLAALLLNPWFIESYLVRDGTLEQKAYVLAADAVLLCAGLFLIIKSRTTRAADINPRSLSLGILIIVISMGGSLAAGEVAVRILLEPQYLFRADEDGWWLLRWQSRQAEMDPNDLTQKVYSYDQYDSMLGWVPKPNYRSEDIRTNSRGIRADREYPLINESGKSRVLFVGDSFTWGEDVANEQTFVAQLEQVMPEVESINLGVHAYGTDQQLLRLKREGLQFNPDVVVLGFYQGNINRNLISFRDYGKPRFNIEDGQLVLTNQPVPLPETYRNYAVPLPAFWLGKLTSNTLLQIVKATKLYPPLDEWQDWHVTRGIIAEAKRAAESIGAEFLLVYIADSTHRDSHELEEVMHKWSDDTNTHYLNFSETFRTGSDEEWEQIYHGHLTPYGNRQAAEAIAAKLRKDVLPTGDSGD